MLHLTKNEQLSDKYLSTYDNILLFALLNTIFDSSYDFFLISNPFFDNNCEA